jgi:hypothetical protein
MSANYSAVEIVLCNEVPLICSLKLSTKTVPSTYPLPQRWHSPVHNPADSSSCDFLAPELVVGELRNYSWQIWQVNRIVTKKNGSVSGNTILPTKIRNAKIQQTEFTNKIFNKKAMKWYTLSKMQVVQEPKSNQNQITSQQSYTWQTCLKGWLGNNQQVIWEPNVLLNSSYTNKFAWRAEEKWLASYFINNHWPNQIRYQGNTDNKFK